MESPLLLANSLFLPAIFCAGYFLYLLLFGTKTVFKDSFEKCRFVYLVLGFGIILNYSLILLMGSLATAIWIFLIPALGGLVLAAKHRKQLLAILKLGNAKLIVLGSLLLLFLTKILSEALHSWDARSIWFFHAKIIYYAGALSSASGFQADAFSYIPHMDYPKLIPVLAAEQAFLAGYWNEYLPKFGLFVMLAFSLFGIFSFIGMRRLISSVFLLCAGFLSIRSQLWTGYMDGYLAMSALLLVLFSVEWLKAPNEHDFAAAILSLAVLVNLKNEGLLLCAVWIVCILCYVLVKRGEFRTSLLSAKFCRPAVIALIMMCPFALWQIFKIKMNLNNDLNLGEWTFFDMIRIRLSDREAVQTIATHLFIETRTYAGLAMTLAVACFAVSRQVSVASRHLLPLAAAALYFAGMFIVYQSTPYSMHWHLDTSGDRVLLSFAVMLAATSFFILRAVEDAYCDNFSDAAISAKCRLLRKRRH